MPPQLPRSAMPPPSLPTWAASSTPRMSLATSTTATPTSTLPRLRPATPTVVCTVATPTSMPTESCSRSSTSPMPPASVWPTLVSLWLPSTTALLPLSTQSCLLLPLTRPRLPRPRLPSPRPTPPRRPLLPPLPRGRRGRPSLPLLTALPPTTPLPTLLTTPMLDLDTPTDIPSLDG